MKPARCILLLWLNGLLLLPVWADDHTGIQQKPKFKTLQSVFRYIARYEGLPENVDVDTLLALAAYSHIERQTHKTIGSLLLIEAQYYDDSEFRGGIRGASGNGRLYVFRDEDGFELVAILNAGSYKWAATDELVRIQTWVDSGCCPPSEPKTFLWNGHNFVEESQRESAEPIAPANGGARRR